MSPVKFLIALGNQIATAIGNFPRRALERQDTELKIGKIKKRLSMR